MLKQFINFFVNEYNADIEKIRTGATDILIGTDSQFLAARIALGTKYGDSYNDNDTKQIANGFTDKIKALVPREAL